MTTVVNIRTSKYDIYIGRSKNDQIWGFGNPFKIGPDGTRNTVCDKFETWLKTGETFGNLWATSDRRQWILNNIHTLKNKVLGCFCEPDNCHGRILAKLANEFSEVK